MTKILEYRWVDDETCNIYLGGNYIYNMNHGEHGWSGMEGIRDALNAVASSEGFMIVIDGDEGV